MLSRCAVLIQLALLCVGMNCLQSQTLQAGGRVKCAAPADAKGKVRAEPDPAWDVKGWGRTREEAEQDALTKARGLLQTWLRRQDPPILWTPPTEFIREHLVRGKAQRQQALDQDVPIGDNKVRAECWSLPVSITEAARRQIDRHETEYRREQRRVEREAVVQGRMLLLAQVLAVVLAALLAVAGYIRLDDWTKGYYSRVLVVIGAGLVAAAVVGVFLIA